MAEGSEKATGNGTAAVIDAVPVSSPNMDGETDLPVQRTVTTVDKLSLRPKRGRPPGSVSQQARTKNLCVELINGAVGDSKFQISCERRAPGLLQIGNAIPQGPVSAIREYLEQQHGPGVYVLKVTEDGIIIPQAEGGSCELRIEGKSPEVQNSEAVKEQSEKAKLLKLKVAEAEAEAELKRTQRKIEREEVEAKREAKDAEESPTVARIAELESKLEAALKPKPSEWTLDKIAVLLTAAAPIIQLFIPKKDDSIKEVLQTINQTNKETNEKLIRLLEKKEEKGGDKDAFEIFRMLRKELKDEEKDKQAWLEKMTPRNDDDIEIDPNNIWGSLAAAGVKGIIHLFKTGGPGMVEAIQTIAANVGKKPEQLTDADTAAVQRAIAESAAAEKRRPLQLPPQQQVQRAPLGPPRPLQLPQRMNAPANGVPPQAPAAVLNKPSGESPPGATAQTLPTGTPPTIVEQPAVAPVVAGDTTIPESIPDSSATASSTGSSVAPFKLANPKLEDDLVLEINKSVEDMVIDIESGRMVRGAALVWIDDSLDRWNTDFLKYLATIESHMERYKVIRSKASADSLEKLDNALMEAAKKLDADKPGESTYLWNNFHNSFEVLTRAFLEQQKERKT